MALKNKVKSFFSTVTDHKLLFLLLFAVQIIFIISMAVANVKYQAAIAENIQNIIQPLETANYDENAIKAGMPFLEDVAQLATNYTEMLKNLQKLVFAQLLVFFTVGLLAWALTHLMFKKENVLKLWVHLVLRAAVFIVPVLLVDYLIIRTALRQAASGGTYTSLYVAVGITAVAWYFMVICLALPLAPLKESLVHAFSLGVKKIHYTLGSLIVIAAVIGVMVYLVALSVTWAFWLMMLLSVVLVLLFVFARVFFVAVVSATKR